MLNKELIMNDEERQKKTIIERSGLVAYLIGLERYADAAIVTEGMKDVKNFAELSEDMSELLEYVNTLKIDPLSVAQRKIAEEKKQNEIKALLNNIRVFVNEKRDKAANKMFIRYVTPIHFPSHNS